MMEEFLVATNNVTQYRSAKTGEFVTKRFAETHKSTTVKEQNPAPKPAPSPRKK